MFRGFSSSVCSYPERGKYGNNRYRGNCTGKIIGDFIATYHRDTQALFADPSIGSGTSVDVAKEMGVRFYGTDLHQGFNLLVDDFAQTMGEQAQSIWWHPPYWDMICYSGSQWGEEASPWDLSRLSLPDFIEAMVLCMMNIHDATRSGGHYGILMGNMRRQGRYYNLSSMVERVSPGTLVDEIIKIQHNCMSDSKQYNGRFVSISHEKLLVFRKKAQEALFFLARTLERSASSVQMTWKSAVRRVLQRSGKAMALADIYDAIEPFAKERENNHWQAKVRQVLQDERYFSREAEGVYRLLGKNMNAVDATAA